MPMHFAIFSSVSIVVVGFGCYLLGRYNERLEWNNLIKQGKLPRPKGQ